MLYRKPGVIGEPVAAHEALLPSPVSLGVVGEPVAAPEALLPSPVAAPEAPLAEGLAPCTAL